MLKDLMVYLLGLKRPETIEIDERIFKLSDYSPVQEPTIPRIDTGTLSSITDYITSGLDSNAEPGRLIVHIKDEDSVALISEVFGQENQREHLVLARNPVREFNFDYFMSQESFVIGLLSQFEMDDNLKLVLNYASKIKRDESVESSDDGVTQLVTAKTGVASLEKVTLPNPIELQPRRTFTEIEQPKSMFVFRVSAEKGFALFEADSGAWKLDAIEKMKKYYEEKLEEQIESGKVVILA